MLGLSVYFEILSQKGICSLLLEEPVKETVCGAKYNLNAVGLS